MERDSRYGAFLLLAIVFVGVFFAAHFARYGVNRGARQTPSDSPLSGGEQSLQGPSSQTNTASSTQSNNLVNQVFVKTRHAPVYEHKIDFPGFPIDINTAGVDELMKVPGIGPKIARNIIEKRTQIGGFLSINQLTEVKRIGRVKLDKIRRYIAVKAVKTG